MQKDSRLKFMLYTWHTKTQIPWYAKIFSAVVVVVKLMHRINQLKQKKLLESKYGNGQFANRPYPDGLDTCLTKCDW